MSQRPHSPSRLEQDSASTQRGFRWRAAAKAMGVAERRLAVGGRAPRGTAEGPARRLVDLLSVEPGYRIAFLDDPGGLGGRLAGNLLSRQRGLFLYGLNMGAGVAVPPFKDECFDLIVAAGEGKHWPLVSRTLGDVVRLVRPEGIVAVIRSHATSVVGRGMQRIAKPNSASADPRDAHDVAVGRRLVELFGSASRMEQGSRVVWQATREFNG